MSPSDVIARGSYATHEVTNQPPPLVDYDTYATDRALCDALAAAGVAPANRALHAIGRRAGSAEAIRWGFEANEFPPQLNAFDRFGRRIDEVTYHPAYHRLLESAVAYGLHAGAWREPQRDSHVVRAAGFYVWSQAEAGHGCPVSMTHAAVAALRLEPELAREWEPLIFAETYDGTARPAAVKGSALIGMAMTEKHGGSDVRANTTRAERDGDGYRLTGHKWFCSAPMCDAFLVLAQAPDGLSCFLVPRFLPDGTRNAFALQRLKNKLGNRSNASSEVEFDGTFGRLVGAEGRGLHVILEMVNLTRLDCIIGSAAGMRQAVAQAVHHAYHRSAFGKPLSEQPLMQNVLADLALEAEAATVLFARLAQACDLAARGDEHEVYLRRIGTALGKYWVCKRAAGHAAEALESLGGNGYVEESMLPRLYREAPLNSLWEGAGNVNALDVLRAVKREPDVLAAFFEEVDAIRGADAHLDAASHALRCELAGGDAAGDERRARYVVERMALVLQGALLVRASPDYVADAFCASRLGGDWGHTYGTLARTVPLRAVVERARPIAGWSARGR